MLSIQSDWLTGKHQKSFVILLVHTNLILCPPPYLRSVLDRLPCCSRFKMRTISGRERAIVNLFRESQFLGELYNGFSSPLRKPMRGQYFKICRYLITLHPQKAVPIQDLGPKMCTFWCSTNLHILWCE